jgi:hypothetical protein
VAILPVRMGDWSEKAGMPPPGLGGVREAIRRRLIRNHTPGNGANAERALLWVRDVCASFESACSRKQLCSKMYPLSRG